MSTPSNPTKSFKIRPAVLISLLALLAPVGYLAGRFSATQLAGSYIAYLGSGVAIGALGAMIGIPIGLFFGSLRAHLAVQAAVARPNTLKMEHDILTQLRAELVENQTLFEARKGSTTLYARIAYLTPFWTSIMASGRLFVMQDAQLLNTVATAYYWLNQATHLEILAYEAKYADKAADHPMIAAHLISEVRLLDGRLQSSLAEAIAAIDTALKSSPGYTS
ncbi:MAG TPA: hypothetical protein VHQ86_04655 [Candidatus Saccharimonadia bacterium]|jgi:hypothetical protein|nr:hypothetical protein [Candidatus Saccharimonadia bacterium]